MLPLTWWEELDFDWEIELLLLDDSGGELPRCSRCGLTLNTAGTCSNCDYRRRP